MIVGGGELGLELGLAFRRFGLRVQFISRKESPVQYIQPTGKGSLPMVDGVAVTLPEWDTRPFINKHTYTQVYEQLTNVLAERPPSLVILEDAFLTASNWESVQVLSEGDGSHTFVPDSQQPDNGVRGSQILDRISTLNTISDRFDGKYHLPFEPVNSEDMSSEDMKIRKTENSFDKFDNRIAIKPETTSSGHGVAILDQKNQIKPALNHLTHKPRSPGGRYLVEKALNREQLTEAFVIALSPRNGGGPHVVGPFEYCRFSHRHPKHGGPFRLKYSAFPSHRIKDKEEKKLLKLARKVASWYEEPFIGIEFFIHEDKITINELTWRPDDVGIITLLSHEINQFEMFRDAVIGRLDEKPKPNPGLFICQPILRQEAWSFYPPRKREQWAGRGWVARLYNKGGPIGGQTRRVYGYCVSNIEETTLEASNLTISTICRQSFLEREGALPEIPPPPPWVSSLEH